MTSIIASLSIAAAIYCNPPQEIRNHHIGHIDETYECLSPNGETTIIENNGIKTYMVF